jgi:pilus assembly protein CpaB
VTFGLMAVVLGLVAAYIVKQAMHKPVVVKAPVPVRPVTPDPGVQVVFARTNIPKNARISAADLAIAFIPRDSKAVAGSFTNQNIADGRIAKQPIRAGQVLREEYMLAIGEGLPDLAERLPSGMRAVTIDVEGAEAGGKRLSEGDFVDISLTVEGTHPDLGEVTTRTLMHNVMVVDAAASRPLSRGARPVRRDVTSLTVAVKPADANKLTVAQRTGNLSVNLVAATDLQGPGMEGPDSITRRQLLGLKEITPPAPVVPAKKFTVEKWSGGSLRVLEMSDDRVREARDVSTTTKPIAAPAAPAQPSDDFQTNYVPSGVDSGSLQTVE